jgi:hypothetical protein
MLQGFSVAVLSVGLACAPMAVASASHKKHHKAPKHHTSKTVSKTHSKTGSNPGAQLCVDIAKTDTSSGNVGGSFAAAQQAMIASINAVVKEEGPAESVLSSAPANVQAALKGVFGFENSFKAAVASATSMTGLAQSVETLGANPAIKADSLTLASYVTSVCGTTTTTTG